MYSIGFTSRRAALNFVHSVRLHDLRYPDNVTRDIPSSPLKFETEKPNGKTKFGDAFAPMWEALKTALTRSPAWKRGDPKAFATDARTGKPKVISSDAAWPLFVVKTEGDQYSLDPQLTNLAVVEAAPAEAQAIATRFDPTAVH